MKHFGNSLSYEEIIEDMKETEKLNVYIGTQEESYNTGQYKDGVFIKTGEKTVVYNYRIFYNIYFNKWCLESKYNSDKGYFNTVIQAKNKARRLFGKGIKWNIK